MAKSRDSLKVGIVTLSVLAGFFMILIWISQSVSGRMQSIAVRFRSSPSMPTLAPGSDVLVGGQKVGKIVGTELKSERVVRDGQAADEYYVNVEAEVLEFIAMKKDCKVIAEGPPLGGDGIMKIDPGTAAERLDPGQVIEGAEPAGFAAILASLQSEFDGNNPKSLLGQVKSQLDPNAELSLMAKLLKSVNDVNVMTAAMGKELGSAEKATLLAKIHAVADNINAMTGSLRAEMSGEKGDALMGKVHRAVDSVNDGLTTATALLKTNEAPIGRAVRNVEATTEHIAQQTDPARADSLMAHLKKTGEQLNQTLDDIHTVTSTTREVVVLNRENINRLLMNFKESSDHLKTGLKYVLRHPWRLLNAPAQQEIRQQAIFDAARSFADAATRVDDATSQLRALAELHGGEVPANHPDLVRIEADLKQTGEQYRRAEAELWKQLDVR